MANCLKTLLTSKDNETHDLGRWSWLISLIVATVGAVWNAIHSGIVDISNYAQTISIISGAHAGSLWVKKDTEPLTGDKKQNDITPPSMGAD